MDKTDKIISLRKQLHAIPEPSMREEKTKQLLMEFIKENTENLDVEDRGLWFYAVKKGTGHSEPIAFRADYDAVTNADGMARHLCGHDGHSAILAGFSLWLDDAEPERDVYLIFQPGEETGEGGRICSELIDEKKISEIYGFHNIPGYMENEVVILDNTFACASTGLELTYTGRESHAAYPEQGANPGMAMAETISTMNRLIHTQHKGIVLGTVIGMEAGSSSYGVSAGQGILRLTLRAEYQDEYDDFVKAVEQAASEYAEKAGIKCTAKRIEEFPATLNHAVNIEKIRKAAEKLGLATAVPSEPFRWSEDFGYYLQKTNGAFFGVGCGKKHPGLHTEEYVFNDNIIDTVISIYRSIAEI